MLVWKSRFLRILYAIPKYSQTAISLHPAPPLRVLPGMDMVLWMRHEPEHVPHPIAYPGNIQDGAVRVGRIFSIGRSIIWVYIDQRNLIFGGQPVQEGSIGNLKIPFAMCDRAFDQFKQAFCPEAFLRNRSQRNPPALKASARIKSQRSPIDTALFLLAVLSG
jgi:hypothetical protein